MEKLGGSKRRALSPSTSREDSKEQDKKVGQNELAVHQQVVVVSPNSVEFGIRGFAGNRMPTGFEEVATDQSSRYAQIACTYLLDPGGILAP